MTFKRYIFRCFLVGSLPPLEVEPKKQAKLETNLRRVPEVVVGERVCQLVPGVDPLPFVLPVKIEARFRPVKSCVDLD